MDNQIRPRGGKAEKMSRELRRYLAVSKRARQKPLSQTSDTHISYDGCEESGPSRAENSTSVAMPPTTYMSATLPTGNPSRSRRRRDDKTTTADVDSDDEDDDHSSTSTRSSTSTNKATALTLSSTTSSSTTLVAAQTVNDPSSVSATSTSSVQQHSHHTSEALIVGTIFGVFGGILITVLIILALKYRKKRINRQQLADDEDQNSPFSRRNPGMNGDSIIWGGTIANTEYRPPVPDKSPWYKPEIARSVGDRVSRLWGGSQATIETVPTESGGQIEKTNSPVPPVPVIPAVYVAGRSAQIGDVNDNRQTMLSEYDDAPPAAYLSSKTKNVRDSRLDRVRDEVSTSRRAANRDSTARAADRDSTATIPRFRTAESWVADQAFRLELDLRNSR